ncbi:dynein heavy chain 1 axonemal-like protein [Holotrichia oblita]|uniref:Dynein heavy chain 1 axonemal-like protein n=1 Tax=Holotrichia oblita TaxID=644536 RepID=A0ACB9T7X5_HOLOL|nr:dynein heavy chain 1 axonemal-like protein [Holotrichia oblita]
MDREQEEYKVNRRGYYSEAITDLECNIKSKIQNGTFKRTKLLWQVKTEHHAPIIKELGATEKKNFLAPAERWMCYEEEKSICFPVDTFEPKVQMQYVVPPFTLPRNVAIERRRRQYQQRTIKECLDEVYIKPKHIVPTDVLMEAFVGDKFGLFPKINYLPLELFDDEEYDNRTPQGWIEHGVIDGISHPIPGEAFIPISEKTIVPTNPIEPLNYFVKHTYVPIYFQLEAQVRLNHKRALGEMEYRDRARKQPYVYSFLKIPPRETWKVPLRGNRNIFDPSFAVLIKHLKTVWLDTIAFNIRMCLGDLGKGWFNIGERKHEIYDSAKLMRFMELVKYHMQYALRLLVQNSATIYTQLVEAPCQCCLECEDDFKWSYDLITTPFRSAVPTIFALQLLMNDDGAYYSTDPDLFPLDRYMKLIYFIWLLQKGLLFLYDNGLALTHTIKQVHPLLLTNLKFPGDLCLSSVGLLEDFVNKLRNTIQLGYKKAIIPLKAYAKEYDIHLDLFKMDVNSYVE